MGASDTSTLSSPVERGAGLLLAVAVSYVVNPLVLPPLLFGLVLGHVGAPPSDVAAAVGIGAVFFCLVPLLHVGWLWGRGVIQSLEVRERSKRTGPLVVVLAAGVAALAAVSWGTLRGEALLAALIGCHVVNTFSILLITTAWKISIHCAALAGTVGALVYVRAHVAGSVLAGPVVGNALMGTGLLLMPLLAWARVRSGAHTQAQVAAGTALGFAASYVELLLLARLGLF
jgi:hypothetical protein